MPRFASSELPKHMCVFLRVYCSGCRCSWLRGTHVCCLSDFLVSSRTTTVVVVFWVGVVLLTALSIITYLTSYATRPSVSKPVLAVRESVLMINNPDLVISKPIFTSWRAVLLHSQLDKHCSRLSLWSKQSLVFIMRWRSAHTRTHRWCLLTPIVSMHEMCAQELVF